MSFWPDGCQVAAIWRHTLAKFNLQLNYSFLQCNYVPKAVCLLVVPGLGMLGMRRFAIVGAGLLSIVGFASAASAADLPVPVKTPPPIAAGPVPFSWTGCHVGGNVGGAFSYDKIRSSGDFSSAGFVGGGQVGCDYQFASAWVVGVEGRAAWSSLNSKTPGTVTFFATGISVPTHFTLSNDFLSSATARVGYSFADRWLIFVRGGAAWTREKADLAQTVPAGAFIPPFVPAAALAVDPSGTMTRTGWTAGTGLEWAFAPHWSASFEYNYYDFGDNAFTLVDNINGVSVLGSLKDRIHTVTTGVNYHF
jgi:outer membrane immunogenic protein